MNKLELNAKDLWDNLVKWKMKVRFYNLKMIKLKNK